MKNKAATNFSHIQAQIRRVSALRSFLLLRNVFIVVLIALALCFSYYFQSAQPVYLGFSYLLSYLLFPALAKPETKTTDFSPLSSLDAKYSYSNYRRNRYLFTTIISGIMLVFWQIGNHIFPYENPLLTFLPLLLLLGFILIYFTSYLFFVKQLHRKLEHNAL
ncbi:MAG: hypothetical protein K6G65_06575 [Lachnospiraceae bacterium]|nr:hypothetical protein [Lachnospiraceae bacterium]